MNTQEWLSKLVSYDTTSLNSNVDLISIIEKWLLTYNITCTKTHNEAGDKANLFATIPTRTGNIQHGLILSGHTDVVPVDGQDWKTNPFVATHIDDRIYGRGTSDMKGFLAVMLALAPTLKQLNLKFPLYLAFSYDEEIGCRGVPYLIEEFQNQGIKPIACIVGEPTEMQPVISHKGIHVYQCQLVGKAMHSSLTPDGCNAIDYAADLISWIRRFADELKHTGPYDTHFDIPFTTLTTNLIKGGTATNIIPSFCEFFFEFRNLPNVNPDDIIKKINDYIQKKLLPTMQKEFNDAKINIKKIGSVPSFMTSHTQHNVEIINKIIGNSNKKVSYATEAGLFEKAGIPTIICGPGSIEQAHRPDEFITLAQLKKCEDFIMKLCIES